MVDMTEEKIFLVRTDLRFGHKCFKEVELSEEVEERLKSIVIKKVNKWENDWNNKDVKVPYYSVVRKTFKVTIKELKKLERI